jgi:signal peptidase II
MAKRSLWLSAGLSLFASIASVRLAEAFLAGRIPLLGDTLGFQYSTNRGVAFGVELPEQIQGPLILLALAVLTVVAARSAHTLLSKIGFGLVLGGGLGNVIDRIPDGLVTDFFQVGSFPIFNVADSCITAGVALLFLDVLLQRRRVQTT